MRNATPQVNNPKSHWVLARAMTQRSSSRRCPTWRRTSVAVLDDIAKTDGYAISQQKRKLREQGFGWAKFVGPIRQVMVRGLQKLNQLFVLTMAAYNLTHMRTLEQIRLQTTYRQENDAKRPQNYRKSTQRGSEFQITKSVPKYSAHADDGGLFADQYFSSLLNIATYCFGTMKY